MVPVRLAPVLVLALLLVPACAVRADNHAGVVTGSSGSVQALSTAGVIRGLEEDDLVYAGDRIETQRRSSVALEFRDGTVFSLGESSSMTVDAFDEGDQPTLGASVLGGIFRFVSGLIAKREPAAMTIKLTVATIGIRGTDVVGEVSPTSATVILLEPTDQTGPTAIEVSNAFGAVVVDEPGFGTEIPDANSPPSPPRRMSQRNIQNLMRTLQSIGRIGIPVVPRF